MKKTTNNIEGTDMKESNEYLEKNDHSIDCNTGIDKLQAAEIGKIIDLAGKKNTIDHSEIRQLTKLILKIDPVEVDESLQAKFNQIMHKVKAQYA